jgi:hypothetical protein
MIDTALRNRVGAATKAIADVIGPGDLVPVERSLPCRIDSRG